MNDNGNLLLIIGAVVLLAAGAFYFFYASSDSNAGYVEEVSNGVLEEAQTETDETDADTGLANTAEEAVADAEEVAEATEEAGEEAAETVMDAAEETETAVEEMTEEGMNMATDNPIVVMETNKGLVKVELYMDLVPVTAGNFIKLTKEGYYDGLIFHRIIEGFVVQGGDPYCVSGEGPCGTGGPGWSIPLEIVPELRHGEAGMFSMARSADPDSAGSQFYITLGALPSLDDNYAVFGKVIEGLDVVMEMGSVVTDGSDKPVEDVIMTKVYVMETEE